MRTIVSEIRAGFPIKYGWWWRRRFYFPARRAYYRLYGLREGGMAPKLGRGKYVSVRRRGPFLDLTDERTGDLIRLVPYQPNHGVMVELWQGDNLRWRTHCSLAAFRAMGFDDESGGVQ